MKVFTEDGDFRKFLDLAGERVDGGDLIVHAFCLMSNHYHLLLETPRGGLSRWMHGILGTYAEWFNFTRKRRGHLWQGRYKAILVERGPYLLECSRYIHLNPNRAGLTRPAERWEWSSYRNYVSALGKPAVPWVTVDTVLGELGASGIPPKARRNAYREYVESGKGEKPISPFERATAGLALGGESFVAWVKEQLSGRALNQDEPSLKRFRALGLVSPARIEESVKSEFGDPRVKGTARSVLSSFLVSRSGLRPADVARDLGVSRCAVTLSRIRVDEKARSNAVFAKKIRKITARLLVFERDIS